MLMTEHDIRKLFPNASASLFKANAVGSEPPRPKPQCDARLQPLAAADKEKGNSAPCKVSVTSYRRRLLDIDNLYGGVKWFVDALRYEGVIRDDDPQSITLHVSQVKVKTKQEACTVIEIN